MMVAVAVAAPLANAPGHRNVIGSTILTDISISETTIDTGTVAAAFARTIGPSTATRRTAEDNAVVVPAMDNALADEL